MNVSNFLVHNNLKGTFWQRHDCQFSNVGLIPAFSREKHHQAKKTFPETLITYRNDTMVLQLLICSSVNPANKFFCYKFRIIAFGHRC